MGHEARGGDGGGNGQMEGRHTEGRSKVTPLILMSCPAPLICSLPAWTRIDGLLELFTSAAVVAATAASTVRVAVSIMVGPKSCGGL